MTVNPEATEERTRIGPSGRAALWRLAGPWWLFLVTGIAWLIIAVMVLRFTPASVNTVSVLMGVLFLLGAFNEFLIASIRHTWRWAHVVMGVLFVVGAIWAFARPFNAFWAPAWGRGLWLTFKGTLAFIAARLPRRVTASGGLGRAPAIREAWRGSGAPARPSP